jgi:hypothetical protein
VVWLIPDGVAHVVPEKTGVDRVIFVIFTRTIMRSRTGLEAEAINRLTDGVQPEVMRAILVQCLAGEVAPSGAISRMLAEGPLSTVRAAIDDVTHRAATISRASDKLVHDRVDELTQVFVENVAALADIGETSTGAAALRERTARAAESADRGEMRTPD